MNELECELLGIASQVRKEIEEKYMNTNPALHGTCVAASERVEQLLTEAGYHCTFVEGWVVYDDDSACTDRCYDEHSWIECEGYYIDVTASQFNSLMETDFPNVIVSKSKPESMVYDEPEYRWLDEI